MAWLGLIEARCSMAMTIQQANMEAIQAEKSAEDFYLGLAFKFRAEPEVAAFWKQLASEEVKHAEWLKDMIGHLDQQEQERLVDSQTEYLIYKVGVLSVEKLLANIHNLEEAFETAISLENGETNTVFCFLINSFKVDQHIRDFLLAQLALHISRLSTNLPLPCRYSTSRQAIKAL
jgi:rubrerythrin